MANKKKINILLVDDDPSMQRMVTLFVSEENIELDIADNGRSALQKIRSKKYDILITDMQMPLMDGHELIEKIRELGVQIQIIIISAFSHEDIIGKFESIGAFGVLQKPFDSKKLKSIIYQAMGKTSNQ